MARRREPRAAQLGVTDDDYARLLEAQDGHCALCPSTPKSRKLHVDHDHATGQVRGLLCHQCNRRIWHGPKSDWYARAAEYLSRSESANGSARPGRIVIDVRLDEMRTLRETGMTYREIGERYGITRQAVHQLLK